MLFGVVFLSELTVGCSKRSASSRKEIEPSPSPSLSTRDEHAEKANQAGTTSVPQELLREAVTKYYAQHVPRRAEASSNWDHTLRAHPGSGEQLTKVRRYELQNSFNRTIDSEQFQFCDIAVETTGIIRDVVELLPFRFVKRGNSWYWQIDPERQVEELPPDILSANAVNALSADQQEEEQLQRQRAEQQRDARKMPKLGTKEWYEMMKDVPYKPGAAQSDKYPESPFLEERLTPRKLVNKWVEASNGNDVNKEASIYTSPTDYLDEGWLTKEELISNLASDRKQWPNQAYKVTQVDKVELQADGQWRVRFRFAFDRATGDEMQIRSGTGTMEWLLRLEEDGSLKIARSRATIDK